MSSLSDEKIRAVVRAWAEDEGYFYTKIVKSLPSPHLFYKTESAITGIDYEWIDRKGGLAFKLSNDRWYLVQFHEEPTFMGMTYD